MKKQNNIKFQLKLLPLILGMSAYSVHTHAIDTIFELNNGQVHEGNVNDNTPAEYMYVDIVEESTLNGNLSLSGNETQYNVRIDDSTMNGDITFSGIKKEGYNNGVDIDNHSTLTGNITIARDSSASIHVNGGSEWNGRLDAATGFNLDIDGGTKDGGIFYNSGDTPSNDTISINVGGGWDGDGETPGHLKGPIKIIGQTDPSVDMTNAVDIFIGEGGVVQTGPEGLYIDNNGQGLNFSSETEGGARASWTGNIVVKENSDANGTTHSSSFDLSGGIFDGNVSVPVLERLGVYGSTWKGDIDVIAHNDNAVQLDQTRIDMTDSFFDGNINYSGNSDNVNIRLTFRTLNGQGILLTVRIKDLTFLFLVMKTKGRHGI